jgi:hypothetical protein
MPNLAKDKAALGMNRICYTLPCSNLAWREDAGDTWVSGTLQLSA